MGRSAVNAAAKIRRPLEPVSISILSIVWQFVVLPGAQIVTVVYSVLAALLFGPPLTTAVTTFAAGPAIGLPEDPEKLLLPPQAARDMVIAPTRKN